MLKTNRCFTLRRSAIIASCTLIVLFTASVGNAVAGTVSGLANPNSIVVQQSARFTILTPQLIRLEWSEDTNFEDSRSLVFLNRDLPVPAFSTKKENGWLEIRTNHLTLRYRIGSGRFNAKNLAISQELNGEVVNWHPGITDSLNLKGTTRTLDSTGGEADVRLDNGLISQSGWALVDDSVSLLFDGDNWVKPRPAGDRQDWYFFGHGHDYRQALEDFTLVAGKIPMPPRWAFGYWWSKYWSYSDRGLRGLVQEMKDYNIPLDVLVVDMDWHLTDWPDTVPDPFGQWEGWTGYTWNKDLFPDPEKFLSWAEDENIKIALNLHPASGISPMEEKYHEFGHAIGFDTSEKEYIPFAMADRRWAETYFDKVLGPIEDMGVDFWWLDWQQWIESKLLPGLNNTWWLNHVFYTEMEKRRKSRPITYHRWGGLGNHRYPLGFSGDVRGTWDSLAFQPYFTATASNVGYGYWGHDLGGFNNVDPDPELYVRWLQFGALSPIFKTHSGKSVKIERRFWRYPKLQPITRSIAELRYSLAPYIYTAARQAYDTGISIVRPMYYDYPEAGEAYQFKGQYMFGDDMLVAPVTVKSDPQTSLAGKAIWLPEGHWYEWFSGTVLEGGRVLERQYALHEIPLFVKAGAVIPMYGPTRNLQEQADTLVFNIIPGGDGDTKFYEDHGDSLAYRDGEFAWTTIRHSSDQLTTHVTIVPDSGRFEGMPEKRRFEIRLPSSFPPARVTVNGLPYEWSDEPVTESWTYSAEQLAVRILTPETESRKPLDVAIDWAPGTQEMTSTLQGKIGQMRRATEMLELIRRNSYYTPPQSLLNIETAPVKIQYQPQNTAAILKELKQQRKLAAQSTTDIRNFKHEHASTIIAQLFPDEQLLGPPRIELGTALSNEPTVAEVSHEDSGVQLRYTLDGTIPNENSSLYTQALELDRTSTLTARAFREDSVPSVSVKQPFVRSSANEVQYGFDPSRRYSSGSGTFALTDGLLGTAENPGENWVGTDIDDMVVTLTLPKSRDIDSITTRFLVYQEEQPSPFVLMTPNRVYLPTSIQVETSRDGVEYALAWEIDTRTEAGLRVKSPRIQEFVADVKVRNVTHVRISARNLRYVPEGHTGAGNPVSILSDEILID